MLSPVRTSHSLPARPQKGAAKTLRPATASERSAAKAPERFDAEALDRFLDGLYGENEPKPDADGPIKVPEYLNYRRPRDPFQFRGTVFNLVA